MTKRALITGVAGQDGTYLTELLLGKGYEVFGVLGPYPGEHSSSGRTQFGTASFTRRRRPDRHGVAAAPLSTSRTPDEVYNFAAQSSVGSSWSQADRDDRGQRGRRAAAARGDSRSSRPRRASSRRRRPRCSATPPQMPQREKTPICTRARRTRRLEGLRAHRDGSYRDSYGMHASNGDPVQPRVAAAAGLQFVTAQDHRRRRAHQARSAERAAAGQSRRAARLGLRRRLRRGDVAACCSRRRPDDFVVATGEVAHGARLLRGRVRARRTGLRAVRASSTPSSSGPSTSTILVRRPDQGARPSWAGSRRSASTSSSR